MAIPGKALVEVTESDSLHFVPETWLGSQLRSSHRVLHPERGLEDTGLLRPRNGYRVRVRVSSETVHHLQI